MPRKAAGAGVVFASVNGLSEAAVGQGYHTVIDEEEPEKAKELVDEFGKEMNLDSFLPNVCKNMLIAGFCPVETKINKFPAKSALKIPVIGMAESMYRVASLLADRWGLIVGYTGMSAIIRKVIQAYGVADYVTSIKTLHIDPFQTKENRAEVEAKFIAAGKELISEDAGLVINHCSPLFAGVGREALARIREQLGVVLDPYDTALKTAEMLVKLGLSQSRMAFPSMKLGVDPAKGVYRIEKLECYPGKESSW